MTSKVYWPLASVEVLYTIDGVLADTRYTVPRIGAPDASTPLITFFPVWLPVEGLVVFVPLFALSPVPPPHPAIARDMTVARHVI